VKSGHPVSNEEEKIEHISKRSVEEKIWDKEDWSRKKLHEEAHGLFCSCGVLVSLKEDVSKKKTGPCDGNGKNGKCIRVILTGKLI